MADRWEEELAKAERKIRQKTAKGLLKAEKALLKVAQQRERMEERQQKRAIQEDRRLRREEKLQARAEERARREEERRQREDERRRRDAERQARNEQRQARNQQRQSRNEQRRQRDESRRQRRQSRRSSRGRGRGQHGWDWDWSWGQDDGRSRPAPPAPPAPPAAPAPPAPPAQGRRSQGRRRSKQRLTPEERAYRDARRRANAKIGFLTHFITYVSVNAFILISTHNLRATLIVAAAWGIGIAIHYFGAVVAPGLRRRLIEDEVGRSVAQGVTQERRAAETRHERSMEDLSASIAHEIRNPVAAAKSLVQHMGEDPVSDENIEYAQVALDELDRVERSISHLLRYARDEELSFDSFDMSEVIQSTVESYRDRIDLLGVELELQLDTPGRMRGDPEKMRRVLVNLVGNALDALEQSDDPVPRLQILAGENLAGTEVWVRVKDNGPGIHPDVLDKIFSPFFTTKDKGTGLGLALSKKIVDAHGGTMEVDSHSGAGTEFVLGFPKDAEAAA